VGEGRAIARTAGRALDVLLYLVERGQRGLSTRELAERLGAPRTSVADLLKVLQARGFVAPTEGGWRLDFRVLQLGNAYLHEFSVRDVGKSAMRELSRRTGLTSQMAVLDRTEIVYIERQDARRKAGLAVATDIGSRLPAHCTSLGKAMLAHLPDEEVDQLYDSAQLSSRTRNTITSFPRLKLDLALVRRRGFAVDLEETSEGIVCVGSAIVGSDGRPEAAISLSVVRGRLSKGDIEALGRMVARAAAQISSARGGAHAISKVPRAARRPRARAVRRRRRIRGAA
jgi:DNA-binding IclR family transcriptional regulator